MSMNMELVEEGADGRKRSPTLCSREEMTMGGVP